MRICKVALFLLVIACTAWHPAGKQATILYRFTFINNKVYLPNTPVKFPNAVTKTDSVGRCFYAVTFDRKDKTCLEKLYDSIPIEVMDTLLIVPSRIVHKDSNPLICWQKSKWQDTVIIHAGVFFNR